MRDWFQPTPTNFYDMTEDRAQSATVSASPEEIKEVARGWAKDLGWLTISNGQGPLVFQSGHQAIANGGLEMEVDATRDGTKTHVRFDATAHFTVVGADTELVRVAKCFADGVLSELIKRGAVVEDSPLGHSLQNRKRLRRLEMARKAISRFAIFAWIPAALIAGLATGQFVLAWVASAWTIGLFPIMLFIRFRMLGMRARIYAAIMWTWVGFMLISTPLFILFSLGIIGKGPAG